MLYPELDTIDNLVPSCAQCNNFKHSSSIEGYRWLVNEQFENVPKNSTGMRQLMRFGLVDISPKPVVFWFEKQGLEMKSEGELCSISQDARDVIWKRSDEERCVYHDFGSFICTLRHIGSYYLVIATNYDWERVGEIELPSGRLVEAQAAEWALKLKDSINTDTDQYSR
jgi:hypothetical protein